MSTPAGRPRDAKGWTKGQQNAVAGLMIVVVVAVIGVVIWAIWFRQAKLEWSYSKADPIGTQDAYIVDVQHGWRSGEQSSIDIVNSIRTDRANGADFHVAIYCGDTTLLAVGTTNGGLSAFDNYHETSATCD